MSTTYKLITTGFPREEFSLKTGAYRVGSAEDNEIVLEDESVAPHHCEVVVTANTLTLRNLSPSHETFVNDKKIDTIRLEGGQTIRLGNATLILEAVAPDPVSSGAIGEQVRISAASLAKAKASLSKPFVRPALAAVGILAIAFLLYQFWPFGLGRGDSSRADSETEAREDLSGEEPETPLEEVLPVEGGDSGASTPPPSLNNLPAAFNPNETNRPPDLDVETSELHIQRGNYVEAEPFLQRALRGYERMGGTGGPAVTSVLNSLGNLYRNLRQFEKAEPVFRRSLENVQKTENADPVEIARARNNLGEVLLSAGEPSKAAPLLEKALELRKETLKPDDLDVGISLNNVAALRATEGDYEKARSLLEDSLRILEENLGADDPTVGQGLNNLGELHRAMGEPGSAEPLLEKALTIKETAVGPNDPSLATTLNGLAAAHAAQGEFSEAEPLYERAVEITETAMGSEHPDTAASIGKLAGLYRKMGKPGKASPLFEQARRISEKALGPDHPQTVMNLRNRAALERCQGDQELGSKLTEEAFQASLNLLGAVSRYASREQRLLLRGRLNPIDLAVALESPPRIAEAALRYKAVVVDSLLEERLLVEASGRSETSGMVKAVQETKEGLSELLFEIPGDFSQEAKKNREAEITTLVTRLGFVEQALQQRLPAFGRARGAASLNVADVQKAIGPGTALVEIVRYSRCPGADDSEPYFGALVLAQAGEPRWVPLGSAKSIGANISRFLKMIQGNSDAAVTSNSDAQESETELSTEGPEEAESDSGNGPDSNAASVAAERKPAPSLLRELYGQIWAPIKVILPPGTKSVVICPDGVVNLLNFAALMDDGDRFLCETYSIRCVSTARDLISAGSTGEKESAFIFANPDFSASSLADLDNGKTNALAVEPRDMKDFQMISIPKQVVTPQEIALVHLQATQLGTAPTLYVGPRASEAELSSIANSRFIHFGTLGFVLPDSEESSGVIEDDNSGRTEPFHGPTFVKKPAHGTLNTESARLFGGYRELNDPTHRSGVLLAGAAASQAYWNRSRIPRPENDGVVTADELGALKLDGTEVVVLSACRIGEGPFGAGEAFLALRRAMIQAGASSLIIGLRGEGDEEAAKFIAEFYSRLRESGDVTRVFAELQRDRLFQLRNEKGVEAAVRSAGAFLLSSIGPGR